MQNELTLLKNWPSNNPALLNPRVWLKTPKGVKVDGRSFVPSFHQNISVKYRLADMLPVRIEGKTYLVGLNDRGHNSVLKLQLAR